MNEGSQPDHSTPAKPTARRALDLNVPRWLPFTLLCLLIGLQVLLADRYHASRGYFPGQLIHSAYTVVVDQARLVQGYVSISPPEEDGQDSMAIFDGRRGGSSLLTDPAVLWEELTQGWLRGLWRSPGYWNDPSLSFFLPSVLHGLSGDRIRVAALTPQVFLAVMLLSIYGIGRRWGGPWLGLAAAAVATGYPGIVELARTHHDSMATGAMAIAVVCGLMYTDGFSRLGACVAAGFALFVSSCVGESISGFMLVSLIVAGPLMAEVHLMGSRVVNRWPRMPVRPLVGLALFAAPMALLFDSGRFIYFGRRQEAAWGETSARAVIGSHVPEFLGGVLGLFAYFFEIALDYVLPLMAFWLVVGVVLLRRAPRGGRAAVALSVAVPLVLLSVMPKKASWYILPVLPGLALLTVMGLRGLKTPWIRRGSLGLAATCGVAMPLFLSYVVPMFAGNVEQNVVHRGLRSTVSVCGLSGGFNWQRSATPGAMVEQITTVGPELVALDRGRAPHEQDVRRVAIYGASAYPIEGLRYVVEMSEPELFVIDFLNPIVKPETRVRMMAELEDSHFEYLLILDERGGLRELPPQNWDPLLARHDWMNGQSLRPQPERDALLLGQARRMLKRPWQRVELSAGPVYVAVESSSGHDKMPSARAP